LSAFLSAQAQQRDSIYVKKKLKTKEVSLLMSFYTQDNDHSAVTGGIGTEDLQVYATDLGMRWGIDSVRTIQLDGGVDIISSASTDNIDFEISSASKVDARSHIGLSYDRFLKNGFVAGVNGAVSIESDYTSLNAGLAVAHTTPNQSREWSVDIQAFLDDLRWGRFESGRPQKLVYPDELRNREWFDEYNRYSLNISFGWIETINKRTNVGFYPGLVLQKGLLSTPFHRIYFSDGAKKVELLPSSRVKIPLGLELNTFVGYRFVVKANYRFYWDDFGITAHTASLDIPYKVSRIWTILPSIRYYTQTASDFFQPYKEHQSNDSFYTSDYDLSKLHSIKIGMGFRYAPFVVKRKRTFEEVEFRYNIYKRSDGLLAHMMTVYLGYSKKRSQ
jgi:hypothetical protein